MITLDDLSTEARNTLVKEVLKNLSDEVLNTLVKQILGECTNLMLKQQKGPISGSQEIANEYQNLKNASMEDLIHMLTEAEREIEQSKHALVEPILHSPLKTWHDKALENRKNLFDKLYDDVMTLSFSPFLSASLTSTEAKQAEEIFHQSKQLMINFANKLYKIKAFGFATPKGPYKVFHIYNESDYNIYKGILEEVLDMFFNTCLSKEKEVE